MTVLANARLLTMDPRMTVHECGWLSVEGSRIADLGPGDPPGPAGAIDCGGDLLLPGFVNTHCHMPMTLFRGLGEDVDDRLFRYVLPLEREAITPRTVAAGARLAALESIRAGVTTVADMYYFEAEIGRVCAEAGIRCIAGQTLADFDPPDHASFDEGFALAEALVDEFADHPLVTPSIAPHAPYSTGPAVLERVARWSADHPSVPVQIHLAEMASEMEWCAREHGTRPVELVSRAGLLDRRPICAHCLHVNDDEIALMADAGITVAHNARSNAKAGRGIAPVSAMREAGIPVGIGTDGPMSGNTLDLFAQFGPVSMFQKLAAGSRKAMPAMEVIQMATSEGATALGLADTIGSLETGKQADLIRVSVADPRMQPLWDPYAALAFSAAPQDVVDVLVGGQWLMRDRQVLTLEHPRVLADAAQVAQEFGAIVTRIDRSRA